MGWSRTKPGPDPDPNLEPESKANLSSRCRSGFGGVEVHLSGLLQILLPYE
jgi:hypothetical protein